MKLGEQLPQRCGGGLHVSELVTQEEMVGGFLLELGDDIAPNIADPAQTIAQASDLTFDDLVIVVKRRAIGGEHHVGRCFEQFLGQNIFEIVEDPLVDGGEFGSRALNDESALTEIAFALEQVLASRLHPLLDELLRRFRLTHGCKQGRPLVTRTGVGFLEPGEIPFESCELRCQRFPLAVEFGHTLGA